MLKVTNTDGQLLCASNCAYFVNPNGHFQPPPTSSSNYVFYQNLGAIGPIQAFPGGPENINAAILFETANSYTLAFRGTLPPDIHSCASWLDWMQDIIGSPTVEAPGLPGKVHLGFATAYETLQPAIFSALQHIYQNTGTQKPLYITGHSKGGPMASYAAYQAAQMHLPVVQVVTFASPHPGDEAFANSYNSALRQFRYENDLDAVPFLPPSPFEVQVIIDVLDVIIAAAGRHIPGLHSRLEDLKRALQDAQQWNYAAVGVLKYITAGHRVVPSSPDLWLHRLWDFAYDIGENGPVRGFEHIAAAHSLGCGGGYQQGVYPGLCPSASSS